MTTNEYVLVRTDRNGTKYWGSNVCPKCNGTGYLPEYWNIEGGKCFKCEGSGKFYHEYKEYTPEYAAKLAERRAKREAAKQAKLEAEKAERIALWRERNPEAAKMSDILHGFKETSKFVGEVGQKIEVEALYVKCYKHAYIPIHRYDSGLIFIHIFSINGCELVWKTSTTEDIYKQGKTYKLKGTIKEHKEFNEVAQTILTRCKITE